MTTVNETTSSTPDAELQTLREHNKQLLAELKTARAELKGATEANAAAQARLRVLLVDQPLAALCERVSPHPAAFARILQDYADVVLDDHDAPALRTKDGQPLTWQKDKTAKPTEVAFSAESMIDWLNETGPAPLRELLVKPRGTGALGSSRWSPAPSAPAPAAPAPLPFGLR